jgi:hypothetical protein
MASYCDKMQEAEANKAHIAVVLYGVLEAESLGNAGYGSRSFRETLTHLTQYRECLKKPEARQAVADFLASRFGGVLHDMGFDVDITSRIEAPKFEVS